MQAIKRVLVVLGGAAMCLCVSAYAANPDVDIQATAHEIAQLARGIGLPEDDPIIVRAQELWWEAEDRETEVRLLANLIWNEAPYCSDRHQQLVAQVALNRVYDGRFPGTLLDVICQPGQYRASYAEDLPEEPCDDSELQRCFNNAREALSGAVECPPNVLFQSEYPELGNGTYETHVVDTGYYASTTFFNFLD